jgi:hypothetical protein
LIAAGPSRLRATPVRLAAYSHERGRFSALRNARVLLYFPHGFGDWVQFAVVLPLLEPSNRYWMTRYGDDNIAVIDGCGYAEPVYLGLNGTQNGDGALYENQHFGLDYDALDGSEREVLLPDSLAALCERERIDALLWTSFPEIGGTRVYPYHSKARNIIRHLAPAERLNDGALAAPLPSPLRFEVDPAIARWVEARLMNLVGLRGRRLCLIARNGYTSIGKNWGHEFREDLPPEKRREGEECRDFMRLLRRKDDRWRFLIAEDRLFAGDDTMRSAELGAYSYAELFGTLDQPMIPFGLVMKVLARVADLCVGVPVGPYHLCMAKPDLPTVGLWIEHLPSWFDEPKEASIHVISRNVRDRALDRQPGSFFSRSGLRYRSMYVETRAIMGEQVLSAVEALL